MKNLFVDFFKELLHRFFGISEKQVFKIEKEKEKYRISHVFDVQSEKMYYDKSSLSIKAKS